MLCAVEMVVDAENNADWYVYLYVQSYNVGNFETGHNGFIKCNLLEWPLCSEYRMMTCLC